MLKDQIEADLKDALRTSDEVRKTAIRMLMSAIRNAEIAAGKTLSDEDTVAIVQREIKQRRDSIDQFTKGNRPDLAAKEAAEIATLEKYLPEQVGDEELRAIAQEVIARTGAQGPSGRGKVMGPLMARVKGRADGRRVNEIVTELLSS